MPAVPEIDREARRLTALASYDILDTPTEPAFDEIAALVSRICDTPIAVVNLIGEGRQFFKAEVGLGVRSTPLETSFCATAILEEDFLLVPDATKDSRFDCNPLVTGETGLRFYAGALLKTEDGLPIGTLCVLDTRPRDLTDLQRDAIQVLARQIMAQLEARRALTARLEEETRHSAIVESATDYAIIATDLSGRVTEWNIGAELILGWSEAEMRGQSAECIFTPKDRASGVMDREMEKALTLGRGMDERWHLRKSGARFWASGEMMPLFKNGSILTGYIKILRDRTDEKRRADQLIASEARLRASQKAGKIGAFEVDLVSGVMTLTPEFCEIFGVPETECDVPATFEALIHEDDRTIPSSDETRSMGDAAMDVEYRVRRASDGAVRWIARRAEFQLADGRPITMFGTVQDITQRKRAEIKVAALLELGDRLRDAADAGEVIDAASEILARTLSCERAGYAVIDRDKHAVEIQHSWVVDGAQPFTGVHDLGRFSATERALAQGHVLAVNDIRHAPDLSDDRDVYALMDTQAQIMVPLLRRGDFVGVLFAHNRNMRDWMIPEVNFARNVADRTYAALEKLRAEADQSLLNEELSHRLKNTLAMVQAIATQTLKNVTERDAVEALTSRIIALSTAHDILLQQQWHAAKLEDVARGVLALHGDKNRMVIAGPPVQLSPRAGLSVSLLLNELATNAAKYGALSTSKGRIEIEWQIETEVRKPMLKLCWREVGGPSITAPSSAGFGSRLIKMGLVGTGETVTNYLDDGLIAEFSAPLSLLQQD